MPYSEYAPFALPSKELDAELARLTQGMPQGPMDEGYAINNRRVVMNNPVLHAYAKHAYGRADKELAGINMPMIQGLSEEFPHIDPSGKYCRKHMEFAQRIAQLENAVSTCGPAAHAAVDSFLKYWRNPIWGDFPDFITAFKEIQCADYASKVCRAPIVQEALERQAVNIAQNDPAIQKLDRILTAMEQVTGLKDGMLDPQAVADFNNLLPGRLMNTTMPTGIYAKDPRPETAEVDFQNFDNIVRQEFLADLRNHEAIRRGRIPKESTNLDALTYTVGRYGTATAHHALDNLFGPVERFSKMSNLSPNRATLTIVDGKTVSEHMQEIYNKNKNNNRIYEKFDAWYARNIKPLSAQIVAAALMAGKRVEAFVPDKSGKLPDKPTVLHKKGYEPTPDKPVTLTAWEKFFSKFGFFKKKVAQAKEHQAFLDARERLRATYTAAQTEHTQSSSPLLKEMFFGDFLRENNLPNMDALADVLGPDSPILKDNVRRGSLVAVCIGKMAEDGYDIQQILDPTKLVQEKQNVGKQVMENLLKNQTLIQLTDPNANLTQQERDQLKQELENTIVNDADKKLAAIRASRPRVPEALAGLTEDQIYALEARVKENGQLNKEQEKELKQLQALQANSDQQPLTQEQTQKLHDLTQQQQEWELHQQLEQWRKKNLELYIEAHQVKVQKQQDVEYLNPLLTEAENNPNFRLNMADRRMPKALRKGDAQWIGEVMFRGSRALTDQINAIAANTDWNKPEQRLAVMPALDCASHCMFDYTQDIKNDNVMCGFYTAAKNRVREIADLTRPEAENNDAPPPTPTLRVRDNAAANGDASVVNGKTLEGATYDLAEKCLATSNNVASFISALAKADTARAQWIQPYLDPGGRFTSIPTALLAEKDILDRVSPDKTLPFSSRVPEGSILTSLPVFINGSLDEINGINALANALRPSAKTILSGDFANSFNVQPTLMTTNNNLRSHQFVRIDENDNCRVVREPKNVSTTFCSPNMGTVTLRPDAAKKLGFRPQNNARVL